MKLLWHMARRDIRHFWIPVAFLVVLQVLEFWIGSHLLHDAGSDLAAFQKLAIDATILSGVGLVVTFVVTGVVVQEDLVVGPAGWRTRPISRLQLLGAKLLSLFLLLGVVPVLVSLPWWYAVGLGAADAAHAALATVELRMAVVLLALPLAAMTDGMGRFLLCTLVGGLAVLTSALLVAEYSGAGGTIGYWAGASRLVMICLVGGAGLLATAVHQFLATRLWRSIAMIVAITIALETILFSWQWEAPAKWIFLPKGTEAEAAPIKAVLEGANLEGTIEKSGATVVNVTVNLQNIPRDRFVRGVFEQQSIVWADGARAEQAYPHSWGGSESLPEIARSLSVQPSAESLWEWNERLARRFIQPRPILGTDTFGAPMWLSPKEVREFLTEPADYRATFWFGIYGTEVIGEQPVQVGSRFERDSIHARISATVTKDEDRVAHISVRESRPASPGLGLPGISIDDSNPNLHYYLVNAGRTDFLAGIGEGQSTPVAIAGTEIQMRNFRFPPTFGFRPHVEGEKAPPMDLDGATVAAVINPKMGAFSRKLEASPLAKYPPAESSGAPTVFVAVRGEVVKPSEKVGLKRPTLRKALRFAAGLSDDADARHVTILRLDGAGQTNRIVVDVEAFLQTGDAAAVDQPLAPGDIVEVPRQ